MVQSLSARAGQKQSLARATDAVAVQMSPWIARANDTTFLALPDTTRASLPLIDTRKATVRATRPAGRPRSTKTRAVPNSIWIKIKIEGRQMKRMSTAPTDGTEILVLGPRGWRRAYYVDCKWLRNSGEPSIRDCWRTLHGVDIELNEARGWKPAAETQL